MSKAEKNRRKRVQLESLELRQMLTAPVAAPDHYTVEEDGLINLLPTGLELVPQGAQWFYLDDGSDQGTDWTALGFDDSGWSIGNAQLGYGDGDEATVIGFGDDPNNKYPTSYFRHHFQVPADLGIAFLVVEIQRDDGAAVYLNGAEIVRDNVPQGAEFDDFALGTIPQQDENAFFGYNVDANLLQAGENVLAVEVHQADGTSSDLSFDLRLTAAISMGEGVLSNDTDADGDTLTAIQVSNPENGLVYLLPEGQFAYLPNANFHGTDSFQYYASDGSENSQVVTVTIEVQSVNDVPATEGERFHALAGSTLNVPTAFGVLNNDLDIEGDPLTAMVSSNVSNGTLTLHPDGSFAYTPNPGFTGTDSFRYVAHDGVDSSIPTLVNIAVTANNDPPAVTDDEYFVDEDDTLEIVLPIVPKPTQVFYTDFDAGVPAEFFGVTTLAPVNGFDGIGNEGNQFSGQFLRNASDPLSNNDPASPTVLYLTDLPVHDSIDIGFLLALIDEWDGIQGFGNRDPDFFNVLVDGVTVFSHSFDSEDTNNQTYTPPSGGELVANEDLWNPGNERESAYDMSLEPSLQNIPHSSPTLTVEWVASGAGYRRQQFNGQREPDSWAIDNVSIVLNRGSVNVVTPQTLVSDGSTWRYLDDGSDQGTAWIQPGFNDSTWNSGPAQLGYGDGDEATVVGFGPDAGNRYPTTYFRHTFQASDVHKIVELTVGLLRDDGGVVYLNGIEVVRDNVPDGAQYNDYASTTTQTENTFFPYLIDPALLVNGDNVLAVEVHQVNGTSTDISFDLILLALVDEGGPQSGQFGVLSNDEDPEGGPLMAQLLSGVSHGSLDFHQDGTFLYTPNRNYNGSDTFTYRVTDLNGGQSTGSVLINVIAGPNEPPAAVDKSYSTAEDAALMVVSGNGLLVGAEDEDDDPLTAIVATQPLHGTVVVSADGSFQYTPHADYFGSDSFTYVANDSTADSAPATVSIEVTPVPDAPRASGDRYFVEPGGSLTVSPAQGVLANDVEVDGQTMTASLVDDVSSGTLTLNADGSFSYQPDAGFHATDLFSYRAVDEDTMMSTIVVVMLTVDATPVASGDQYTVQEDNQLQIAAAQGVLSNDTDGENDPLTAQLVNMPSHGSVTLAANGSFSYTPHANYFGSDTFTYRANDGDQLSNVATVTVTITAVNDPPVSNADEYGVVRNGELTVTADNGVLSNDVDVDGPALTVSLAVNGAPQHGQLELSPDGSFVYTPADDYLGPDQFRYVVTDGSLSSGPTTVSLSVTDPAEDIVINEIMYHPSSENILEEYIEIYNKGLGIVDLTGWQITRGVDYTFPAVTIGPNEYLVIAADTARFAVVYPNVQATVIGGWVGQLSNNGEDIEIETANGERVDLVDYADGGDWALRRRVTLGGTLGWDWVADHDGGGRSAELINPNAPNQGGQNWASSTAVGGSPGAANSVFSEASAPLIEDVKHSPAIPQPGQQVAITADLSDDSDGPWTVEVFYRVSTNQPGPFLATPMFDDGMHGDGEAGDGEYGALLPGQPDDTVVEFYVRASDEQGNARTWPAPTDAQGTQEANAQYQVDTEAYDGGQPIYRLILTEQEENQLININRQSEAQMNATFINVDGTGSDIRYLAGVRIRGNGSRTRTPPNYRVNLPSDDPWQGVDAINLNSQYPHGQALGMTLFEMAGLLEEDATIVQLRVNGIQYATTNAQQGSYVRLEVTNSQWAENHLPLDSAANVYRGINGRLTYSTNLNNYRNAYDKQTNESEDDWSDLIALTAALDPNQTPDNVFVQTLEQVADVNQWMRFLAINALLVNEENGLINGNGDDYTLVCGVVDPRCSLMPHDLDSIFAEGDNSADTARFDRSLDEPRNLPAFNRILNQREYLDLYYWHLQDLATTLFSPAYLFPLMDNLLAPWIDPNLLDQMKEFAAARVEWVLTQIPPNITVPPVATINGEPPAITPLDSVTLTVGGVGVSTYQYRINGGPLSNVSPVATPITLTGLADGTYSIEVLGRNTAGRIQNPGTVSKSWTVDSNYSDLIINEVLANNQSAIDHQGTLPDAIELFNRGTQTIDLSGMSITDDPDTPQRFVFPQGTTLQAGEYLVLYADSPNGTGGIHVGFSLDDDGEGVYLFDSLANGGQLLDQVEFGLQLPNLSIGRGGDFNFVLSQPTFGLANVAQIVASPANLRINEWLASGNRFTKNDFIEIYNLNVLPVDMGGLYLTDNPVGWPTHFQIKPLSFIDARGFRVFVADDDQSAGANHVNFQINANRDSIALLDRHLKMIDVVVVMPQTTDVSQGRRPDGTQRNGFFALPSPGLANVDNPVAARLLSSLRITEIMYNPAGSAEDLEFIELQNVGQFPLDLTGVRLGGGVSFTFPNLMLQPGQITVVANNMASFQARYGVNIHLAGEYTGNLDNGGEEISLRLPSPLDIDILRFRYDDDPLENWPVEADNGGSSLVIVDTEADYEDGSNWQASLSRGGTPGEEGVGTEAQLEVLDVRLNLDQIDPPDRATGEQPSSWVTQRSDIRSITVTFTADVTANIADLVLTNLGVNAAADPPETTIAITPQHLSIAGNMLTLSFAAGELPDGVYRLEVLPTIRGTGGQQLDGNGDGTAGDAYQLVGSMDNDFYRLTGDWNGDGGTTIFDFPVFQYWFAAPEGTVPDYIDLNGDHGVTIFDFPFFAAAFGKVITFPPPGVAAAFMLPLDGGDANQPVEELVEDGADQPLPDPPPHDVVLARIVPLRPGTAVRERESTDTQLPSLEDLLDQIGADVYRGWRRGV